MTREKNNKKMMKMKMKMRMKNDKNIKQTTNINLYTLYSKWKLKRKENILN